MKDSTQPTHRAGGEPTPETTLGRALRSIREGRGMAQQEVAEAMRARGFSWLQTTAAKTEAGQRPFRVNEFVSLCSVLGVDPAVLISEAQSAGDADMAEAMAEIRTRRIELMRAKASLDAARQEAQRAEKDVQRAQAKLHEATVRRVSLANENGDSDGDGGPHTSESPEA
ncbi:helix-turn-helix domain-containing protein [Actinomadura nitritigenes]|uniref:helix-turn-helix domain-containing protein n=1 Tax=Actinomadura nitritigenes TaxID=134602 RepID=UPI003D8E2387